MKDLQFETHCTDTIGHIGGGLQAVKPRILAIPQLAVECRVLPYLGGRSRLHFGFPGS
jgi:hypothetical protein